MISWLLIIQLIRYNSKGRMKGLPPKVNPFAEFPAAFSNQSFANYNSESHTSSHSSFFEATFNRINHTPPQENSNAVEPKKITNPFSKPYSFVSKANTTPAHQKDSQEDEQISKKQIKNQKKEFYLRGKHIRASSTIRQQLFQSKYHLSNPKVSSQYSTEQFEQTLREHHQSTLQGKSITPQSPLKFMEEGSPKIMINIGCLSSEYDLVLQKKDKEIQLLRLQLERYRRCEHINKENEEIYKRLVRSIKEQFRELKEKTESPGAYEPPRQRCINISETTRFLEPQMDLDDIKTPFHLATGDQSNCIFQLADKQILSTLKPQNRTLPQQQSDSAKAMTFNAHQQQKNQATHNKRIITNCRRPKLYHNHYAPPQSQSKLDKAFVADKLQSINQKLWDKQSQRTFVKAQNRKTRTRSYMDLSLSVYHLGNDSNSHLLRGQI